jgi:hypothetical protein
LTGTDRQLLQCDQPLAPRRATELVDGLILSVIRPNHSL